MKQVMQNLKTGFTEIADVPAPLCLPGHILIATRYTLISAGTERMLVEFSRAGLIRKARQQPEKVRQAINKLKTDGLIPTLEAVFRKLDESLPLGYCNAGVVLETGSGIYDIQPGDHVACNGPHAELVCVPRNLCAKIPDAVTDEQATFTVLGSVALHGIRLAAPTLGEKFIVFGLGLVGLLTVQLLQATGCEVLGVDINPQRLKLAEDFGARTVNTAEADNLITAAQEWTNGKGVDGVLVTASARTNDIIHQSAEACRKRGRIILVGVVGLNLRRSDFYKKEISFQVSCSYGPGRYDEKYEMDGQDYPYGYVRWTEQRNFEAVLRAIQTGKLCVDRLITNRFDIANAVSAYDKIHNDSTALGVILQYPQKAQRTATVTVTQKSAPADGEVTAGVIGAGNFSKGILLPALSKTTARIVYIADLNAPAAHYAGRKFGAEKIVTDYKLILNDPEVKAVFIVVGHHLHAQLVCEALKAGKHTFVEKPLALNNEELSAVAKVVGDRPEQLVMVGFNRRFSPHTAKVKELLAGRREPLCMNMTVNAGSIPADHWVQDPKRGGGRIIGEGCHFIDLLSYLTDSPITEVSAVMVGAGTTVCNDKMSISLGFADGSIGTVNYFANGSKSYPKETLDVFSDGRVLRMENFRITRGYGFKGFRKLKTSRQDKGHSAELAAFIDHIATGGEPLIPFNRLANITRASFAAVESARTSKHLRLG